MTHGSPRRPDGLAPPLAVLRHAYSGAAGRRALNGAVANCSGERGRKAHAWLDSGALSPDDQRRFARRWLPWARAVAAALRPFDVKDLAIVPKRRIRPGKAEGKPGDPRVEAALRAYAEALYDLIWADPAAASMTSVVGETDLVQRRDVLRVTPGAGRSTPFVDIDILGLRRTLDEALRSWTRGTFSLQVTLRADRPSAHVRAALARRQTKPGSGDAAAPAAGQP